MVDFLRAWWPVLVLAYLPSVVTTIMHGIVLRGFRRIDESHPDDLPHTAGEWLNLELARLGYTGRIHVITTDKTAAVSVDAYHPTHATIQLTADTYFKRDPMHWAIAAHELGHARFKLDRPVIGELLIATRVIKSIIVQLALALALGNTMFALPGVTDMAFHLFLVGGALHLGVLVDEAAASLLAMKSLNAHDRFAFTHLTSARRALLLAYSTYLVGFIVRMVLLTQWHLVEEISRTPQVPPVETLGPVMHVVTFVLALMILPHTFGRLRALAFPRRYPDKVLRWVLVQLVLCAFVSIIWNARGGTPYAWCVMLALMPITGWFMVVLSLPMIVFDVLVLHRFTKKLTIDPTHRTDELRRDLESGKSLRQQGNAAISVLLEKTDASYPPYAHRLITLSKLTYLPLLIAYLVDL